MTAKTRSKAPLPMTSRQAKTLADVLASYAGNWVTV
jgi:hypothetical protein